MKGKSAHLTTPEAQLPEIIRQLETINANLFGLKLGVAELIKTVKEGNIDHANKVIKIYQLETILENLTTKL